MAFGHDDRDEKSKTERIVNGYTLRGIELGARAASMVSDMTTERCPGCGAVAPHIDGPVHPYIEAAPGCWAIYGEVLAREYGDYGYPPIHRLTVDTYAAQHPGGASRLATQSVAVHLAGLQLVLECGVDFAQATEAISTVLRVSTNVPQLDRPEFLGGITIQDVHAASNLDDHIDAVNRWAESTWLAWESQHAVIHRWIDRQLLARAGAAVTAHRR